jgi:rhodanese-related sulfurtransferase
MNMLSFLKKLFGSSPAVDYATLVNNGAQIVDVRSTSEYRSGHIKGSSNIPLQELGSKLNLLDKSKPIITCCASGMRSASAKSMLLQKGFSEVYNGGGWTSLQNKLS